MKDDKPEKPEFFVSRRGRKVGVHQVDLTGIDVESKEPKQKEKSIRSERVMSSVPKLSKKVGLVILGAVIALVAVPLVAGEIVAAEYRTAGNQARKDLEGVVTKTVLPTQKKSAITADQVRTIATQVDEIVGDMCKGGLLDNAAGLYPRAKSALSDCRAAQAKYSALANGLFSLEQQVRYLEKVDVVMKPVATPITDEYAVIGSQQSNWQTAADGLKKLSAPDKLKTIHSDLVTHITAVAKAWSDLNIANNAQNAAGFEESEKLLSTEYEAVRGISGDISTVLTDSQSSLLKSYQAIK